MTNKKFIVLTFFMSFIVFLGSSFLTTNYAEATLFGIKWTTTNAKGAVVKVRNANLPASYTKDFAAGYNQWTNSTARVNVSSTSKVGKGTVTFQAQNKSTWSKNGWGTGEAWAQPINLDSSVKFCSANPLQDPSKKCTKITNGIVWINSSNVSSSSNRRKGVIAHEIGHMLGLAHTKGTIKSSVMCASLKCSSTQYKVQPYDINGVNSLY